VSGGRGANKKRVLTVGGVRADAEGGKESRGEARSGEKKDHHLGSSVSKGGGKNSQKVQSPCAKGSDSGAREFCPEKE